MTAEDDERKTRLAAMQSAYYDELVERAMAMTLEEWAAYSAAMTLAAGALLAERVPGLDQDGRLALAGRIINAAIRESEAAYKPEGGR